MSEITLNRLPKTLQELQAMPQAGLTNPEKVAALTVAALALYPENPSETEKCCYTPEQPYRVAVSENAYSKSQIEEGYLTLYVACSGADSPRPLKLRNKPSTGQWFLWEQQLLTGIRIPKEADPWA